MRPLFLIGFLAPALVFAKASGEHEGVSRGATDLFTLGGFPISNSILTTWIIAVLIIVGVRLAVGTPKLIPGKGQAVVEGLAQGLRDALEPIVGKQMIGKTFPLLCGFFVFILLMNWSGLLPGVGTVKYAPTIKESTFIVAPGPSQESTIKTIKENHGIVIQQSPKGAKTGEVSQTTVADFAVGFDEHSNEKVAAKSRLTQEAFKKIQKNEEAGFFDKYKEGYTWDAIRPANSDLNTTLALSVVSFLAWTYFVLRYAGVRVLVFDLFGNKADRKEIGWGMWILLSFIFLGVGGIEVVSIAFRLISLSFRLFGNVFGGENLIHSLGGIAPYVIPAIAGLLEVLVGLIQAFVFTLLSAVYIGLICNHEGGHDEEHAH
jgi:F0F1-type ATP synthase membrane subunit a